MRFKSRFVITLAVIMAVKGEPSPLPLSVDWGATAAPVPTSNGKSSLPSGKETISPIDASKYAVKSLPDAQPIPRSWAGRMSVPGAAPGNEMFFWLFEPEDKAYNDNLLIWLNGGPGCSSMIGAFAENGPLMFLKDMSKLERNPYSWTKLGHVLYIDQPLGRHKSISKPPGKQNASAVPLTEYLNRADVQAALNVLPSKSGTPHRFETCNQTIIDSLLSPSIQPTPPTESILPSILATYKIPIHIYQGQLDMVINHIAVELVLQNMTWNGKQGLQSRPSIPFGTYFDINKGESKVTLNGSEAGVWAYERGLSYHLFREAGHGVPRDQPEEMWHYVKNVVVGRWSGRFRE
ncbi:hypothetical protein CIHG_06598 [Coccidioides immitis H538.4]|uniref:Uncharacterized protein n=1 Tax=Coccidioides immitis H538.4 TaxID=396776 RepID=A0A0J8RV66_COCIT|nr:hypothetical protein CIHG_06598 [Coccidioides immitis H538.4]